MVIYSEHVKMITPGRRLFLLAVTAGLIAFLAWDADIKNWESLWELARKLAGHFHWVIVAAATATLAFSNQMVIELTNEKLMLRAGAMVKRIPLKEISVARAFAQIGQQHPRFSLLSVVGWHSSFVSQVVKSGVRVSLLSGDTEEFSSNNADHLAAMIDDLARQTAAREPQERVGRSTSRVAGVARRFLPQKGRAWPEK